MIERLEKDIVPRRICARNIRDWRNEPNRHNTIWMKAVIMTLFSAGIMSWRQEENLWRMIELIEDVEKSRKTSQKRSKQAKSSAKAAKKGAWDDITLPGVK